MTDLHAQIRAEVERRLAVARYAPRGMSDGEWSQPDAERTPGLIVDELGEVITYDEGRPDAAMAAHIVLHDPADAIRRYEYALKVLDMHQWRAPSVNCGCDKGMCSCGEHVPWPCDELIWLAISIGIEVPRDPHS